MPVTSDKGDGSSLNLTLTNIRMSKKSIAKENIHSLTNQKRSLSMVSAADNIISHRKRQAKAVADGYNSNQLFEHTISDIIKVLENELDVRGHEKKFKR